MLAEALLRAPSDREAMVLHGHCYLFDGDPGRACDCYLEVLASSPANVDAALGIALAFDLAGERDRAVDWCERALETPLLLSHRFLLWANSRFLASQLSRFGPEPIPEPAWNWDEVTKRLHEGVSGQTTIIELVAQTLQDVVGGLRLSAHRPRAVLLFHGPEGAGKKTTAKQIARALWNEGRMVAVSGAELISVLASTMHASSSANPWTEPDWMRRLLDWGSFVFVVEHIGALTPEERTAIARMLERGILPNPWGRAVNLMGAIVVLTIDSAEALREAGPRVGIGSAPIRAEESVRKMIGNDLQKLVDGIFSFAFRSAAAAREGVEGYWNKIVKARFSRQGIDVSILGEALDLLVERGWSDGQGLERMKDILDEEVIPQISRRRSRKASLTVGMSGNKLTIRAESSPEGVVP